LLDYTGLTAEETQAEDRFIHPSDVEQLRYQRREALANGTPFHLELRVRGRNGRYRWFFTQYNPPRGHTSPIHRWYGTQTDIDDKKQAEERLRDENISLCNQVDTVSVFEEIVGASAPLRSVLSWVTKVAPTDSTVLITGETGTGKELIARAIHKRSARAD